MKYLPSTKIIILILAILIGGSVFFYIRNGENLWKGVVFDRGAADGSGILVIPGEGSTQGGGNWQDTLNTFTPKNGEKNTDTESMTSKLANGIIARAPELQSGDGTALNEQSTQDVVNSVLKGLPAGNVATVHTQQELSVTNDSSTGALKTYGDSLASVFITYSKKLESAGYEITIVQKAINTNDGSGLATLSVIENVYKDMIHDLATIRVPKDASAIHLNLMNAYEVIVSSIRDMESVVSDPAKGLVGISRYRAGSQIIQNNITNLNSLFTAKKVVFERGNTGFIFSSTASQ